MMIKAAKATKGKFNAEKSLHSTKRELDGALARVAELEQAAKAAAPEGTSSHPPEWWQEKCESLTAAFTKQQGLIKKLLVQLKEETHRRKLDSEAAAADKQIAGIRSAGVEEELAALRARVQEGEKRLAEKVSMPCLSCLCWYARILTRWECRRTQ